LYDSGTTNTPDAIFTLGASDVTLTTTLGQVAKVGVYVLDVVAISGIYG
jgi:hypothetical protein